MSSSAPTVSVFGSINMDLVVRCKSLPVVGQTLSAESADEICGGKGANQAVAAALAGGDVRMIGRIGDDAFSPRLLNNLRHHQVCCDGVSQSKDCASGLAIIAVESSGENAILLVAGANGRVSDADVNKHRHSIETSDALLVQLEVPTASVLAALRVAKDAGVRRILDPAPVATDWTDDLLDVDLVCPNESEASILTGMPVDSIDDANAAAMQLAQRGAKNVVITLGQRGTVLLCEGEFHHVAPTAVQPVDTTAAGDAFAGALAVRWAETDDLLEAVRFASVAGALATTGLGAQPSLATRSQIEAKRKES